MRRVEDSGYYEGEDNYDADDDSTLGRYERVFVSERKKDGKGNNNPAALTTEKIKLTIQNSLPKHNAAWAEYSLESTKRADIRVDFDENILYTEAKEYTEAEEIGIKIEQLKESKEELERNQVNLKENKEKLKKNQDELEMHKTMHGMLQGSCNNIANIITDKKNNVKREEDCTGYGVRYSAPMYKWENCLLFNQSILNNSAGRKKISENKVRILERRIERLETKIEDNQHLLSDYITDDDEEFYFVSEEDKQQSSTSVQERGYISSVNSDISSDEESDEEFHDALEYIGNAEEDMQQTSTSVQERGYISSVNSDINSPLQINILNVGEGDLNLSMHDETMSVGKNDYGYNRQSTKSELGSKISYKYKNTEEVEMSI